LRLVRMSARRAAFGRPPGSRWREANGVSGSCAQTRLRASYRREAKNSLSSSAQSSASRPPATSGRWFRRGSARTCSALPQAPALGSLAP